MSRRVRLAAILLYVTLDLSLPSMPGAFVFDPAESVESTHGARARVTSAIDVAPAPVGSPFATVPPSADAGPRRARVILAGPPPAVATAALRRTPADGAVSSADPH